MTALIIEAAPIIDAVITGREAPAVGAVLTTMHRSPLTKAVAVMRTVAASREGALTVRSIAHRSGLPLSTAGKVCARLRDEGALERHPDGTLSLGAGLQRVVPAATSDGGGDHDSMSAELRKVAAPFMENLHLIADARVVLRDWTAGGSRVVAQIATSAIGPLRISGPLTATPTSGELALLAFAHPARLEEAVLRLGDRADASARSRIGGAARAARRFGHAAESTATTTSIAVPVYTGGRYAGAALCLTTRSAGRLDSVVTELQSSAAAIGRVVQHRCRAVPPAE